MMFTANRVLSTDMKRFKAAVIGGSGYGGAELIRRLLLHPEVELVRVASVDYVGQPLGAAHPPLTGRTALRFEDLTPGRRVELIARCQLPPKRRYVHCEPVSADTWPIY